MATMIHLTINGKEIQAPEGTTVLGAAGKAGIYIPTLCHHEALDGVCSSHFRCLSAWPPEL